MTAFASQLISLTTTVCALTCILMAAEYLLPQGPLKPAVRSGAGILFLAAVIEQITVIFMGKGV